MIPWLSKIFQRKPPTPALDRLAFADELEVIPASDNPWKVDILDCRPVALRWVSATSDFKTLDTFTKLRTVDGRAHLEADELPILLTDSFQMDIPKPPPEGVLLRAQLMEQKWDVYHWGGRIYVSRSWTGELNHTARLTCVNGITMIDDIRTIHSNPVLARRELHFLLYGPTQRYLMPAPLPVAEMLPVDAPGHRAEKALAGNHIYRVYGRDGWFATASDMTNSTWVSPEILDPWLRAYPVNSNVQT